MCKDSINVCLPPARPPPMSDSIIPFDRFHGQTIASERQFVLISFRTVPTLTNGQIEISY